MGGIVKKVKKIIKKPIKIIGKTIRKVAKKVKKIGKSVMKGVAKFTNKLGPIGMIAMSIAMPYALAGLSTATTAAYTSSNIFIKAVGTIGNQIRLGYQAFNTGMSLAKRGISDVITKTFQKFAPKGGTNMFSRISQGAKNLYTSAKNKLQSVTPKFRTAKEGTVEFFGAADPGVGVMSSTDAAAALQRGTLSASELGQQTLTGQGGWFTKTNATGVSSDRLVTDAINDAYKTRLEGFGPNAKRMYNDIRNKAMEMNTYINDEQIGSFVESNKAARTYSNEIMEYAGDMDYTGTSKIKNITEIADLGETGNYTLGTNRDRVAGTYDFNGNEAFGNQPTSESFFKKNSSKLKSLTKSILSPDKKPDEVPGYVAPSLDTSSISSFNSSYDGTNQEGSQGGSLVAKVYGDAAANKILKYHQNMNLLNSGEIYI